WVNVARLAGDYALKLGARSGEYILLDRESGDFVKHTIFFTPTEQGKGILITPTVDGNILLGPTAEVIDGESKETSANGLNTIIEKAKTLCKGVPLYNTITSFAGIRAFSHTHDFIIRESEKVEGLIHCAGIESPGLSSAPAIAKYVTEEIIGTMLPLTPNAAFNGVRKPDYFFKSLSVEEKNELIKKEPAYGKIVCRCEQITEGEILRAIRENPPATTVDGVKRRTRAGMGRCQGGFCQPHVAELIARELNIPFEEVKKSGKGSNLVLGVIK
ncbi:MAG: FAD-dependent oxidoreductase, partial [Clostridiales bacterium]|nr:FAD-dependent oxidoreductase [Clostridiales bacterium]